MIIEQTDSDWLLKEYYCLNKNFRIGSIDCLLDLADIYERVEFAAEDLF